MADELISIIVPIYNVEKYLRQCLDSIQKQTYPNFECIMVNDGSPDHSSKICEEFVEKDSRFKYF
ncbi:glycosyltransferase family 2 protein, partial [Streptococcus pneumoniae]